jgi:hypothetical protein
MSIQLKVGGVYKTREGTHLVKIEKFNEDMQRYEGIIPRITSDGNFDDWSEQGQFRLPFGSTSQLDLVEVVSEPRIAIPTPPTYTERTAPPPAPQVFPGFKSVDFSEIEQRVVTEAARRIPAADMNDLDVAILAQKIFLGFIPQQPDWAESDHAVTASMANAAIQDARIFQKQWNITT